MSKPIIVTETEHGMVVIDYDEMDDEINYIIDEAIIRNEEDIHPDDKIRINYILKKLKLSSQISIIGHEFFVVDCIGGLKRLPTRVESLRIWLMIVREIHSDGPSDNNRRYIL
jgi:hypothetical protein